MLPEFDACVSKAGFVEVEARGKVARNNVPMVDAIIVGLGAMGSATLYQLAKRGVKVLGLEAQPEVAHSMGSSHGLTRIIRFAYFEHPSYVPMVQRSYALWRDLEAESGMDLLTVTGCLDCSPPNQPACHPMEHSCFRGSLLAAREHGLAHEVLTGQQTNERFPGYSLPEDFEVLYQPDAGLLVPERGIQAHVAQAQRHGAKVACGTKVLGWEPATHPARGPSNCGNSSKGVGGVRSAGSSGGVEGVVVHTEGPGGQRASYWARRLVLAPGAWLGKLVPDMQILLQVERQVVGWFDIEKGRAQDFQAGKFPVFLLHDSHGYYYGFPADEMGFKTGKYHHMREVVDPSTVQREVTREDEEVLRECVDRYFPSASGKLNCAAVCLFTNTPDGHFILDQHPRHPQVVIASACSGHGYKFAPVIGEVLADLALKGSTQHDIRFLRFDPSRQGHRAFLQRCGSANHSKL